MWPSTLVNYNPDEILKKVKPVQPARFNFYLFACKLFICFLPALALLLCAFENWPALVLTVLLIIAAEREIETEEIP